MYSPKLFSENTKYLKECVHGNGNLVTILGLNELLESIDE